MRLGEDRPLVGEVHKALKLGSGLDVNPKIGGSATENAEEHREKKGLRPEFALTDLVGGTIDLCDCFSSVISAFSAAKCFFWVSCYL